MSTAVTAPPPDAAASSEAAAAPSESSSDPAAGRKVFVGNIAETVHKSNLKEEFEKFGDLEDIYISTGYAFLTFSRCARSRGI